jgi:fructuronate reductase
MVDRITPAPTPATLADAERLTGRSDRLAVETEPFLQWVIEDDFVQGRPDWDRGGALFVADVAPYEAMKLRMLNGTHSLLAYMGLAAGHALVRDAIADPAIAAAARAHLAAAAATLGPVPGADPAGYARALLDRFANRAIAHRLAQIAMDGTQKLPPRILAPAAEVVARGGDADSFARVTAAWMWHAATARPLADPRADEIAALLAGAGGKAAALLDLPGLMPPALRQDAGWRARVLAHLDGFARRGA